MKKSMDINGSITVTITHVKENRKNSENKRGGGEVLCGHDDHAGYYLSALDTRRNAHC